MSYISAFSGTPTPSLNCSTLVKFATCDSNINVLHILYNHLSGFLVLTCAKKPPDSVLGCPTLVTTLYTSLLAYTIQGGPLLVINGVSTPINNPINEFSWGY